MPKLEDNHDDWVTLQLRGTQNTTHGLVWDWFTGKIFLYFAFIYFPHLFLLVGYLNYQIEHHLFPNMPRHRYPEIAGRVKALCEKHNVPYTYTGLWKSFVDVYDKLDTVSVAYSEEKRKEKGKVQEKRKAA